MQVIEVNSKKTHKEFLNLPKKLYKNDSAWTCLLDAEIEGIFDPKQNGGFKNGDACRWIIKNNEGKIIGRIATFYDMQKANLPSHGQTTGGIGFFECTNNQAAANLLLDTGKAWLVSKGMKAMDGPINFGENYIHWGMLVDGFTHQAYGMPYNFPYYKELFENYGFKTYFEQYSYHVDLTAPFPERQEKFARYVMRKPNYKWDHLRFSNYKKYIKDIVTIYNAVWADFHEDYTPITYKEFEKVFIEVKPMLNEDFIVFAYDEDKPIGMIICFPDLNQVFKKLKNGKLNVVNKLKILYHKKHSITRSRQLLSGVIPEYQKAGIIGPLFLNMVDACKKHAVTELEMSWVGDYNETVNKMYTQLDNTTKAKTHITYRYLFDREKEFVRFTNEYATKSKR